MVMIRFQVKNIISEVNGQDLGSVIFGQSFLLVDDGQVYINVTDGVPNFQAWHTNNQHHESVPMDINSLKNLQSEHLGDKLDAKKAGVLYKDMYGILPVKEDQNDTFDDIVLNGKLVFYEHGFIFTDNKLNAIALPYKQISKLNFYLTKELWLEIETADIEESNLNVAELFPSN